MCKCWYCKHGKPMGSPNCKSFEEFIDTTIITCSLNYEIGDGCLHFEEDEE